MEAHTEKPVIKVSHLVNWEWIFWITGFHLIHLSDIQIFDQHYGVLLWLHTSQMATKVEDYLPPRWAAWRWQEVPQPPSHYAALQILDDTQ